MKQLISEFASDPDMMELVNYFLDELPDRVQRLQNAYEASDVTQLKTLAHQLKGSAGGYGFPTITESAAELERTVLGDEAANASLAEKLEDLLELCRSAMLTDQD
ncbi:MAG: Hpt domain-containing protein [Planctomycetota bacterium]